MLVQHVKIVANKFHNQIYFRRLSRECMFVEHDCLCYVILLISSRLAFKFIEITFCFIECVQSVIPGATCRHSEMQCYEKM